MISGIVTALLLAVFTGAWVWAWRPARRDSFEAAAQLPLEQDAGPEDMP
jgi:cytochrome c oxidase cbb3-type subunit IV